MIFNIILIIIMLSSVTFCAVDKRDSSPFISGDGFRAMANHLFDETSTSLNPKDVKHADIVFVKGEYLEVFFTKIHPHIKSNYILLTHNSDHGVPGKFISYLNAHDSKILMWLGQNPTVMGNPKFIAVPIGIANRMWSHGNPVIFTQVISQNQFNRQKINLLGINFRSFTNVDLRKPVFDLFINKPFCTSIFNENLEIYLRNMAFTKFILCPAGNGLDCHRTWEAFYMGAIPILIHSSMDELLRDLPALIINDWHEITPEFLEQKYEQINNNKEAYNYDKLFLPYWKNLIQGYQASFKK